MFMFFMDDDNAARSKARDPRMTTENNPLFEGRASAEDIIERRNMARLRRDAALKSCPVNGHVYEAFMGTRYGSHREEE